MSSVCSHLPSVFFGGVEIDPLTLRRALKLGTYRFTFDVARQELAILNDEREFMRITCAYESALKFVIEFGCNPGEKGGIAWRIPMSEPVLYSNGSRDARAIEKALAASGLPYKVVPKQAKLELKIKNRGYTLKEAPRARLIEMINEEARIYADVIALWKT